jgi:rhodanese-related sulfurtransferase
MGTKQLSTIGYERNFNATLQIHDKAEFITSLTENMPPAPDHFSRCSDINRKGPALIDDLPGLVELEAASFRDRMKDSDVVVLDARNYHAFGSQHIPDAWHLDLNGNFPTFAGWVLPTDKDILLVAEDYQKALEANRWARLVGMDRIVGYLDGSLPGWAVAGLPSRAVRQFSVAALHERMNGEANFQLLDVRASKEFADSHIEGALNIPVADLRTRSGELNKNQAVLVICSSGNRSSLATSILMQHGFKAVNNVAGGMSGYSAAGYARQCRACENPHGSRFYSGLSDAEKHRN